MKKFASIFVAALICIAGLAQPKSLGLRITSGAEVSYQHNVGENFMELDLGLNYATGVGLTASLPLPKALCTMWQVCSALFLR